jgi:hypothetical protein
MDGGIAKENIYSPTDTQFNKHKDEIMESLRRSSLAGEYSFNYNYTNNLFEQALSEDGNGNWYIDPNKIEDGWRIAEKDILTAATEKVLAKEIGIDEYSTLVGINEDTGEWQIVTENGFNMTESLRMSLEDPNMPNFERQRALLDYKNMKNELSEYKKWYESADKNNRDDSQSPLFTTFSPAPLSKSDDPNQRMKDELEFKSRGYIGMSQLRTGKMIPIQDLEKEVLVETPNGKVRIIGINHTIVNWAMLPEERYQDIVEILEMNLDGLNEKELDLILMGSSKVLSSKQRSEIIKLFDANIETLKPAFTDANDFRQDKLLPYLEDVLRKKILTQNRLQELINLQINNYGNEDTNDEIRELISKINSEIMETIAILQFRLEEFIRTYLSSQDSDKKSSLENARAKDLRFEELTYHEQLLTVSEKMDEIISCGVSTSTSSLGVFGNAGFVGNVMGQSVNMPSDELFKDEYGSRRWGEHPGCSLGNIINFFRKSGVIYANCPLCGAEMPKC